MEETKIQKGPESPADLQWSQGAKNPRKDNETPTTDPRTLSSDTNDSNQHLAGTSTDEIARNIVEGPPKGDTATVNPQCLHNISSLRTIDRLPLSKKGKKKLKKKLVVQIHKGKIEDNFGVLAEMSAHRLSTTLQPKRKWYKQKLIAKQSVFNKIMTNSLEVAILCGGNKKGLLSHEQSNIIIDRLLDSIRNVPKEKIIPKFEQFTFQDGVLLITCFNDESVKWLKQEDFLNLWKTGTVMALNNTDFYKPDFYQTFIPGKLKPSPIILKLLTIQNPGINAFNFTIIRRLESTEGVTLKFLIDKDSVKTLKDLDMKPYFGPRRITFTTEKSKAPKAYQRSRTDANDTKNPRQPSKSSPQERNTSNKAYQHSRTKANEAKNPRQPSKPSPQERNTSNNDPPQQYQTFRHYIIGDKEKNKISNSQHPQKPIISVHKDLRPFRPPKDDGRRSFSQYESSQGKESSLQSSKSSTFSRNQQASNLKSANVSWLPDRKYDQNHSKSHQCQYSEKQSQYHDQPHQLETFQHHHYSHPYQPDSRPNSEYSRKTAKYDNSNRSYQSQNPRADTDDICDFQKSQISHKYIPTEANRTWNVDFSHQSSLSFPKESRDTIHFSSSTKSDFDKPSNTPLYSDLSMHKKFDRPTERPLDSHKRDYDSTSFGYHQLSKRTRHDKFELPSGISNMERLKLSENFVESTEQNYSRKDPDPRHNEANRYVAATRVCDPSHTSVDRYLGAVRKNDLIGRPTEHTQKYYSTTIKYGPRPTVAEQHETTRNYDSRSTVPEQYFETVQKYGSRSTDAERYLETTQKYDARPETEKYLETTRKYNTRPAEAKRYLETTQKYDARPETEKYLETTRNYNTRPTEAKLYSETPLKYDSGATEAERYLETTRRNERMGAKIKHESYDTEAQRILESIRRNNLNQNKPYYSKFTK